MGTPPRALLLDLAGVLADFDRETRLDRLATAAGLTSDEVAARLYDSGLVAAADAGQLGAEEFRAELVDRLGLPDGADLDELWTSAFSPYPGAVALLERLDPALPRGLLTNNDALLATLLPRRFPDLFARLDPVAFAGALGVAKPDAAAYLRAIEQWAVGPGEVLFVDDSGKNVDGARAAGLRAERATGVDELTAVLVAAGLVG
ncbi:HAD family hydrolase [Geodermatophilus sp. URMC 64]